MCVRSFNWLKRAFGTSYIIGIHKYLIKEHILKQWLDLSTKKMFFVFLTSLVNASNNTKCVS